MSKYTDDVLARLLAVATALKKDRAYASGVCADAIALIHSLERNLEEQDRTIARLHAELADKPESWLDTSARYFLPP